MITGRASWTVEIAAALSSFLLLARYVPDVAKEYMRSV